MEDANHWTSIIISIGVIVALILFYKDGARYVHRLVYELLWGFPG